MCAIDYSEVGVGLDEITRSLSVLPLALRRFYIS